MKCTNDCEFKDEGGNAFTYLEVMKKAMELKSDMKLE
jgi:hypothetical protein